MTSWWRKLIPGGERLALPPRTVNVWFFAVYGALTAVLAAWGAAEAFVAAEAAGRPFTSCLGTAALIAALVLIHNIILGGILFVTLAYVSSILIPDAISVYRACKKFVRSLPERWNRCRENLRSARHRMRAASSQAASGLRRVPSLLKASTLEHWLVAVMVAGMLVIIAGSLYLGWSWAMALYLLLPQWLQTGQDFLLVFLLDWLICVVPISLLIALWCQAVGMVIRHLARKRRSRGRRG